MASVKGVKMDLKMLNRLCKVKKNISDEFKIQVNTRAEKNKKNKKNNNNKKNNPSPKYTRSMLSVDLKFSP